MSIIEQLTATQEERSSAIFKAIEDYHQKHYYAIYPSGGAPKEWHVNAVSENIVQPLLDEIERLKNK